MHYYTFVDRCPMKLYFEPHQTAGKKWSSPHGEKLFGRGKKPTKKQYEAAIVKCTAD